VRLKPEVNFISPLGITHTLCCCAGVEAGGLYYQDFRPLEEPDVLWVHQDSMATVTVRKQGAWLSFVQQVHKWLPCQRKN